MWLSNVPHTVAMILFLVVSAMAGRRFKKLVAGAQRLPSQGATAYEGCAEVRRGRPKPVLL